ncbi:MAG: NAD-dependent epimerase/dehydratase family protein, partial [Moorea sp. SIO3C2]|nr:NAD-dependent epimerase/dehydratase family protein [Moorena sp. SIO3C2]
CEIARGKSQTLYLGNTSIQRDWGWAPEYVDAMYRMLQQEEPDDYAIATGQANSLNDFVIAVFQYLGLNWEDHVQVDQSLYRPTDISLSCGNATKAHEKLGWKAKYDMRDVAQMMVDAV